MNYRVHVCVSPPLFPSLLLKCDSLQRKSTPSPLLASGSKLAAGRSWLPPLSSFLLRQTRTTTDAQKPEKKKKKKRNRLRGYGVQHPLPLWYHFTPRFPRVFFRYRTSNPCSQHRLQSKHGEGGADP